MRTVWNSLRLAGLLLGFASLAGAADQARIIKVLPHFIDADGRHTLSPSLYERDAYQAHLRLHPELRGGLRFDVQWKAKHSRPLKLRVELRGARGEEATRTTLEWPVRQRGWFSRWSTLTLREEDYRKFGEMVSWRATLLEGDTVVAEQRSFLW